MSRWITPFESHPFHSAWDNMQDAVKTIKINEISDENILTEIARLKKAIEYIDKYLKLIDPDINITNLAPNLNNFHQYINAVTNELNNFNSSHNVTYMHRANNNIDNCLNTLKVFHTLLPKVSGQGIYSMLKKYNETLEDALSEIDLTSAMEASKSIESLQQRLINGTEGEDSIQAQIEYMFQDTEEKHNELLEYYNTTLNDKKYDTTKEKIENAKDEIEKHTKEAHDKLIELSNKVDDLDKFYVKIFGTLNDEDERVGGLKNELEKRIKTLDDFDKEQQKIYKDTLNEKIKEIADFEAERQKSHKELLAQKLKDITDYEKEQQLHNKNLYEQIESHLPHATSAGLAKAFATERVKFKKPIEEWNKLFIVSLSVMFIATFLTFINIGYAEASGLNIGFAQIKGFEETMNNLLYKLPLYAPLIWLAIYASKRRSENQRLEQEYAHKEALAKSYISYKKQIEGLKQADQELLIKLLNSAVDTISNNASETLDKKHGDGTPVHELTKNLLDEIKKLKK